MRVSPHPDRNRRLPRLRDFDYSSDGAYFVTICTANRANIFGEIQNDKMILSDSGKIAEKYWREIPDHFSDVQLDEFVVMPNHVHGIIWIGNKFCSVIRNDGLFGFGVGNGHAHSLQVTAQATPKKSNLSIIIGSFKSAAAKTIRSQDSQAYLVWQKSFYDHIIRDEDELNRVRDYIRQNPENWRKDENNLSTIPK